MRYEAREIDVITWGVYDTVDDMWVCHCFKSWLHTTEQLRAERIAAAMNDHAEFHNEEQE